MEENIEPLDNTSDNSKSSEQDKIKSLNDNSNSKPEIVSNVNKNYIHTSKDNEYKKKGFLVAVKEKTNHTDAILLVKKVIDENTRATLDSLETICIVKISKLQERIDILKNELIEKQAIKIEYKVELAKMRLEKEEIEKEITDLQKQKDDVIRLIGSAKENLILKRLDEIDKEIIRITEIYENIEKKQNPKFKQEFDDNKSVDAEKVKFYQKVKSNLEETYDDVKNRIRSLNNAGINAQWATVFVAIGWICAIVAGWFFSLWSGPAPKLTDGEGIIKNDSIRFLLIDLVAKYIKDKGWVEIIFGIGLYVLIIGCVSYLGYYLLKKHGFILDHDKLKKLREKIAEDENYSLNPQEQDELFKGDFKANNWYALWLKAAPFIVFIYLTLAVLSRNAFVPKKLENGKLGEEEDRFQSVFDSLTNQFMGSLIALTFAGLFSLYIIKIIEPRTIHKTKHESDEGKILVSWELVVGIILFLIMIISMIIAPTNSIAEVKYPIFYVIFEVSGFLFFCLVTGFTLGYGYRFIGLDMLSEKLVLYLEIYAHEINRLSKPFRVNYLKDRVFKENMEFLKVQMLNLVAQRNYIAQKLTGIREKQENENSPIIILPNTLPNEEQDKKTKNIKEVDKDNESDKSNFFKLNILNRVISVINQYWTKVFEKKVEEEKEKQSQNVEIDNNIEAYFPEYVTKIKEINNQIEERTKRIKELDEELNGYWRNEKTFRSINDQIKNINNQIEELEDEIIQLGEDLNEQKVSTKFDGERNKSLVDEGFYNGIWFLKNGEDLRGMYLP